MLYPIENNFIEIVYFSVFNAKLYFYFSFILRGAHTSRHEILLRLISMNSGIIILLQPDVYSCLVHSLQCKVYRKVILFFQEKKKVDLFIHRINSIQLYMDHFVSLSRNEMVF